ncbi:MAG: aminotransferase class V-fold PLP-dependent enzyme [Pseudomonadota bacterium]
MNTSFDLHRARSETRACDSIIHFNNAGSSLMPAPVSDYLVDFLRMEETIGGYESVERESAALENFYSATSRLINCKPDEVAYAENATRAWDMAFYGLSFQPGDRILTTVSEYGSNVIAYNHQAQRTGVEIVFVPDDDHGQIDIDALKSLIDDRVKLISISQIPTGGGLVNPAAEVGKVANDAGILYLLDACQGVGHLPVDVEAIGCDMLSATGRKFLRGPRATGFLYVRESVMDRVTPPLLDQHAADLISPTEYRIAAGAQRYENWEQFFAGKAALGVAIDYAIAWGLDSIRDRIFNLADSLRNKLSKVDGVELTDLGEKKCGIVTFRTRQQTAAAIKSEMKRRRINVSVSDGSGSLVSFQPRGIESVVRASVHYFNTEDEINTFIDALNEVIS